MSERLEEKAPLVAAPAASVKGGTPRPSVLSVKRSAAGVEIAYDIAMPPEVYLDKNALLEMSAADLANLEQLRDGRGFRFRFSATNVLELVSRLEDPPSKKIPNPFSLNRKGLRSIVALCEPEMLPTPEEEFMQAAGLERLLGPAWNPDRRGMFTLVKDLADANTVREARKVGNLGRFRTIAETDRQSMQQLYNRLVATRPPASPAGLTPVLEWVLDVAGFVLFNRATDGKVQLSALTDAERDRIFRTLGTGGYAQMFTAHLLARVRRIVMENAKPDPRDVYDALQLVQLGDANRLFVTNDDGFMRYDLGDASAQRVVPWKGFRKSP